jgi:hypothetical protein
MEGYSKHFFELSFWRNKYDLSLPYAAQQNRLLSAAFGPAGFGPGSGCPVLQIHKEAA